MWQQTSFCGIRLLATLCAGSLALCCLCDAVVHALCSFGLAGASPLRCSAQPQAVLCAVTHNASTASILLLFSFFPVQVGPHILGAVHSPKLAEALFDLYLGDQPVSKTAKDAAAQTLNRIAASSSSSKGATHDPYYLPQGKSEEIKCEGQAVEGSRRKGSLKSSKGGLGLGLSDLAACVLHMD